jgi:glycerol-3-phosphate dehydrogenase
VRGRIVLNAAGPWADQVLAGVGAERMIGGTKGSHIIVAPFAGAPATALYVEAETNHRPFFIIPWNSNYLIGTTDIRYEGDLDSVEIEDREIDYLLGETNRAIPDAKLSRESILYTYSGVRPLAFTSDRDEQSITRRHFIHDHAPRLKDLLSIVGGKLTTYRSLSEQAVNLVFKKLEQTAPRCMTGETPLPGAVTPDFASFCEKFSQQIGLPESTSARLLRIYGTRAPEVLRLAAEDHQLLETIGAESRTLAAEVVFSFGHELAQTLSDCLLRRTMAGLSSSVGSGEAEAAARIAQEYLGWSEDRARREVESYRQYVSRFHPRSFSSAPKS